MYKNFFYHINSAENENQQLEDLPFTSKTSSVGEDKVNQWEFCKLKFTTIVVFVINNQRIFPSEELAPFHYSGIVKSFIFIHQWSRFFF